MADRRAEQEQRERRHRDDLERDEVGEQRERLRDQHRGCVDGGEQEAVEAALLGVGDEQPVDAEQRGEQERHEQDPRGEVAFDRAAVEREVKDDEGAHGEERHARDGLERAQLDEQLLAQERADGRAQRRAAARRAPRRAPSRRAPPAFARERAAGRETRRVRDGAHRGRAHR